MFSTPPIINSTAANMARPGPLRLLIVHSSVKATTFAGCGEAAFAHDQPLGRDAIDPGESRWSRQHSGSSRQTLPLVLVLLVPRCEGPAKLVGRRVPNRGPGALRP